jgi:hypothetical protein
MMEIPLGGKKAAGRVALIDDEDYALISQYRWCVYETRRGPGRGASGPYAVALDHEGRFMRMHKLITGLPRVDHKNGNGLDNRRENLRGADYTQNAQNRPRRADSANPYKGVKLIGRRWYARITERGKRRVIGSFATAEDAARAYNRAARDAFGEFAHFNDVTPRF